ncbi:MAG: hypothetical protein F9K44_04700 [Hyphomicrobiaceae bacterium]|nr:MAG: hypothetical protein F9K44_04700 [Hyphomicrobiaceae bacterium]
MNRDHYYIAIAFFGMVNGLPFFNERIYVPVLSYSAKVMGPVFFGSGSLIAYFTSLMVSTATIIVGGLPAVIYERYVGAKEDSTDASMWIWLAGTAILTLPAIGNFFKFGL